MKKNKLSIYLVKPDITEIDQILKAYDESKEINNIGVVYYNRSYSKTPNWVDDFYRGTLDKKVFKSAVASAILAIPLLIDQMDVIFLLPFGYGKNMINMDSVVKNFGIKVVLNSTLPSNIRALQKINVGGNQKIAREQLPTMSTIEEFSFDINRDLISSITSYSVDKFITDGNISGGASVSVNSEVDITNIKSYLCKLYKKYLSSDYKDNFSWIDNLSAIKEKDKIALLDKQVVDEIRKGSDNVIAAIPEVIIWEDIKHFKLSEKITKSDITIDSILSSMRKDLTDIKQLKSKYIKAISILDDSVKYQWSAYKCLIAEIKYNNHNYCLTNGQWYCIDDNYAKMINDDYKSTCISKIKFNKLKKVISGYEKESEYNTSFVISNPKYIKLDAENVVYGGSRSKFEICDLLSDDKTLIHVKKYTGSSVLSHLFNQGLTSAELIRSDPKFLKTANNKIREVIKKRTDIYDDTDYLLESEDDLTIVYAVVTNGTDSLPAIPFFSKITFYHIKRILKAYKCHVEICNIEKE